jgi:hypothetical protein
MRFKQATPLISHPKGSYTHTIYWGGEPAYDQLEADICMLPRTGRSNQLEYWPKRWLVIQVAAREWLINTSDKTARAIILHFTGGGSKYYQNWNSLYFASRRYTDTNTQCKIMGNDYIMIGGSNTKMDAEAGGLDNWYLDQLYHERNGLFENSNLITSPSVFARPTIDTKPSFQQPAPSSSSVVAVGASGPLQQ